MTLLFYESKFENIADKIDIDNMLYLEYLVEYNVYVYLYETAFNAKEVWYILYTLTEKNLKTNAYYKLTVMDENKRTGDIDIPYIEYTKYFDRISMFVF